MLFIFFNMWYYMQRTVLMNEPMIIRVCGLEYMNDDPSAVDVLYAKVSLVNDTTRWTHLVFSILSIFCSSVQITWRCAATQFRLHHCPDLLFHRFFEVEVWYYEQDRLSVQGIGLMRCYWKTFTYWPVWSKLWNCSVVVRGSHTAMQSRGNIVQMEWRLNSICYVQELFWCWSTKRNQWTKARCYSQIIFLSDACKLCWILIMPLW